MNFIDWLLILVALASIGAFVYFAFFSELDLFGKDEQKINVEYTLRVEKVNAEFFLGLNNDSLPDTRTTLNADFIDVGDKVYSSADGTLVGRVKSVEYERSKISTNKYDDNGILIYAEYPGYVDFIITVSGSGLGTDGVYSINGYEIKVGSDIQFRTEGYNAVGKCIKVSGKEIENNGN